MDISILRKIFNQYLARLKNEIESYQEEANLWIVDKKIANSGGNLCLHLVGNLNTYLGAELGGSNYVRDREGEFGNKDIPKSDLVQMITETSLMVDSTLEKLSEEDLNKVYPLEVLKEPMTTAFFLTYLSTHLSYHLGQINYHRRLLDIKN